MKPILAWRSRLVQSTFVVSLISPSACVSHVSLQTSFILCWHLMSLLPIQAPCCSSIHIVVITMYLIQIAFLNPTLNFSQAELITLFPLTAQVFIAVRSVLCNINCWYLSVSHTPWTMFQFHISDYKIKRAISSQIVSSSCTCTEPKTVSCP